MRKYLVKTGKVPHTELEDVEVLAGAWQFCWSHYQTSLDAPQINKFISMEHPVFIKLLMWEESNIQHA